MNNMLNRTPKVHIVYCHPSEKSITNTIKQGYIEGLEEINIQYTITDLYKSNFNSDITEEEYLRENNNILFPLAEDVIREQERINNADILTFIFPLFWMDALQNWWVILQEYLQRDLNMIMMMVNQHQ